MYPSEHFGTIAQATRIYLEIAGGSPEDALNEALETIFKCCRRITDGQDYGMTLEEVKGYRDLLGVAGDVAEGFVDDSLGNVREYVLQLVKRLAEVRS